MSGDIIQLSVGSDQPVPVEPVDGAAVVTVGSGDTVYYSDHLAVSATGNQGSIASGASHTFTSNAWIISAGRSAVKIVTGSATGLVPSGAQDVILGSDGKVGGPGGTGLTSSVVSAAPGGSAWLISGALAQAFTLTGSQVYDVSYGTLTASNIAWSDGTTGAYAATLDTTGAVISFTATYGARTVTGTIPRNGSSQVSGAMTVVVS